MDLARTETSRIRQSTNDKQRTQVRKPPTLEQMAPSLTVNVIDALQLIAIRQRAGLRVIYDVSNCTCICRIDTQLYVLYISHFCDT